MDSQERSRFNNILKSLETSFQEQEKSLVPLTKKLGEEARKVMLKAFQVYRSQCQSSFDELDKYMTITPDGEIKIKDAKNQMASFDAYTNVLKCVDKHDKDFEKVGKIFGKTISNPALVIDKCYEKCSQNTKERSDAEISECLQKCNNDYVENYKDSVNKMHDVYSAHFSKLEKL